MAERLWLSRWLSICLWMVVLMIFLGGLTRLTNAGLSITEWQPVSGVIPPLNKNDWYAEFSKYQSSPEYAQLNFGMNIAEFQFIFWLEFIHRLIGRVAGLIYLVPLIYFAIKRIIDKKSMIIYLSIFALFCTQGYMGWYMVKSGLVHQPHVSHIRLAMHLIIAFIIYSLLFWQWMTTRQKTNINVNHVVCRFLCVASIVILYLQVILGALTAGLDAGLVYNDFPLMGESFIADEIIFNDLSIVSLNDPVFVQFLHRLGAYLLLLVISFLSIQLLRSNNNQLIIIGALLISALALQVTFGILTLLYAVPIAIALLHQLGAVLVLSCLLWCYHALTTTEQSCT